MDNELTPTPESADGTETAPLQRADGPEAAGAAQSAPTEPLPQNPTEPLEQAAPADYTPTDSYAAAPANTYGQAPGAPASPAAENAPQAYDPNAAPAYVPYVPGQGYDPNAVYAAGAPASSAPANPADSIGGVFGAMWSVIKLILGGRLLEAIKLGESYRYYWHVAMGIFVFVGALIPAGVGVAALKGIVNFVNTYSRYGFGYSGPSVGDLLGTGLKLWLFGAVVLAALVFAFTCALYFTLKMRGVTVPFGQVATLWSVSATPAIFMMVIGAFLVIIPTTVTFFLGFLVLSIGVGLAGNMAFIANYVGLNRIARAEKSMLVPYVLFCGLAAVVVMLIFLILGQLVS
ncbi:hypothetical protein [Trueperella bernardiae]|uniref:hypothetical protein n=1 Tax=Trueperella bernardiae TaxID=59561 RepID=UPI0020430EEF|nr:hypothetical protein [Trueperella bernardiae]MCM3907950.1 hypothetical protein [Trueperella bernardiae]